MSRFFDSVAFPIGAAVAVFATISVVRMVVVHPPGETVVVDGASQAVESIRYAGALAAWGPHIGPKQLRAFYEHWHLVENEIILRRDHPWAGLYKPRDLHGLSVNIAPKSGVALIYRRDGGAISNVGLAAGEVKAEADHLLLHYSQTTDVDPQALPDRLYPVRWGTRRFLLSENNMRDLVNALNGQEYFPDALVSTFLANEKDGEKAPEGLPKLPAPYAAQLLKKPVAAKVTAMGGKSDRYTVNIGSHEGVFDGMPLYVEGDGKVVLQVVHAGEHESEVENSAAGLAPIKLGMNVSSRQSAVKG